MNKVKNAYFRCTHEQILKRRVCHSRIRVPESHSVEYLLEMHNRDIAVCILTN